MKAAQWMSNAAAVVGLMAVVGVSGCEKNAAAEPDFRPTAGVAGSTGTAKAAGVQHLGAAEWKAALDQKKGLLVDVRTAGEYGRAHLAGSSLVDISDPKFVQKLDKMQKSRPVFVYCATGARSAAAAKQMARMGFAEVYNMQGGIMTWLQAGLPVERGAATNADSTAGLEPATLDALLAKEAKVLVDYQTPWCAPCKAMAPVVDQLSAEWKGKAVVMRVDVDQSEALAAREKIQGVPVFVLYVAGKEKWRHAGEISKADLEAKLAQ